jgi:hypothetical protein
MSAINDTDADLAAIRSDLSNLKGDVASLIEHFTGEVGSGVQGVSNQITEGVRCVSENPAANGKQTAKAIGLWVERRPPRSLGVALGVGYVGVRAFSRRGAPRCTRFHQTRARRGSVQDLSADTSHSVDGQPFVDARRAKMGETTTSQPAREFP